LFFILHLLCFFNGTFWNLYFATTEMFFELIKHRAIKTYWWNGGLASLILFFSTGWRWIGSLTPRLLYSHTNSSRFPFDKLDEIQNRFGCYEKRIDLALTRNRIPFLGRAVRTVIIIPTEQTLTHCFYEVELLWMGYYVRFSMRYMWTLPYSGIWRHSVWLKIINDFEEPGVSIFRTEDVPSRRKQQVPPNRCYISAILYGVTLQMTVIFVFWLVSVDMTFMLIFIKICHIRSC
jgi:hypothetical protein